MATCASCAAVLDQAAVFCPRCGEAHPNRRRRTVRPTVFALAGMFAAVAVAWPGVSAWRAQLACEPKGWIDWHLAMQRACLTPEYVCRNMTSSKLLEDPVVAGELRRALEAGDVTALGALDSLVAGMRAEYGCAGAPRGRAGRGPPRLPPGHPPIGPGGDAPTFDAPAGLDI